MKKRRIFCTLSSVVLLLATSGIFSIPAHAVEPDKLTRSVQNELHARGFYYGAVTGRPEPSTVDALRRFQIRQGLPVTGSPDKATLQALGLSSTAPGNAAENLAPHGAAAASPPLEADRELLRREGLTKPAASPAPATDASGRDSATTTTAAPERTPRPRAKPSPTPTAAGATPPPPAATPRTRIITLPRPPAPGSLEPAEVRRDRDLADDVEKFVRRYLDQGEEENPEAEMTFFADPVDYYKSGRIRRAFIRRDIEAFHRRWPERDFDLDGDPVVSRGAADGTVAVRFQLKYRLQSPREHAHGRAENEMRLRPGGSHGFEIVSVRERKL